MPFLTPQKIMVMAVSAGAIILGLLLLAETFGLSAASGVPEILILGGFAGLGLGLGA